MKILFPIAIVLSLVGFIYTLASINNPTLTFWSISMLVVIAAVVWGKRK